MSAHTSIDPAHPVGLVGFSADAVNTLLTGYVIGAAREAQYADLAGEPTTEAYKSRKVEIGRAIVLLKRAHQQLCALERHAHEWGQDDYCVICGADGRA